MSEIRNISLAASGEQKIEWVTRHMPIMAGIEAEFEKYKPFSGIKIALSVHMEAKTARLCRALKAGGAEMHVTGCNPLSTQDDVAAALALGGIDVHAWHNATPEEYTSHLCHVLEYRPDIIIDDGADLTHLMHTKFTNLIYNVIGGCEETTTGIIRVSAMASSGVLKYPIIAVNNAKCKYMFDNRYGTGQSVWNSINRTTNLIVAGKRVVIAGYGWCGHGIALRAHGLGAKVIICEVDPIHALEAMMDGFDVMPMDEAASAGDVFITSTSCLDVITQRHFEKMKDGTILCNAGHFNVELDMDWLEHNAVAKEQQRENIMGYTLKNGRTLSVIAEGRLVNLASGDGHPAEIMDMSFALHSLSVDYLVKSGSLLPHALVPVPEEIDNAVARKKLAVSGIYIDSLTDEQRAYLSSWEQ